MDPFKKNRMNSAIQRALSDLIAMRVKDPRVGLVSISQVEVNRDNTVAKVHVAVTGDDIDRKKSLAGLRKASGFLQTQVGRNLRMRAVPQLHFVYDDSMDRGFGVEEILKELEDKGEFLDEKERRRQLTLDDFEPPEELVDPLLEANTIWMVGHWSPDPDCIGSCLALAEVFRAMDKDVTVFRYPEPQRSLVALPGWDETVDVSEAEGMLAEEAPDVALLMDCHRTDRTGPLRDTLDKLPTVLCVDHHLVSGRRAPVPGWLDARAESTCTLAYRLIEILADEDEEAIDGLITKDVATNLFAGIAGDTGGFRFDNTTPMTFRLAADLAERGVDTAGLQHTILHERRHQALSLLQLALAGSVFTGGGKVAVMRVTRDMLAGSGATMDETEGFVNILTSVSGVRYACLLKEQEPNVWRASLRTQGGDVQSVAAAFGGGGHKQAAGCTIEGDGDEVAAEVTEALLNAE